MPQARGNNGIRFKVRTMQQLRTFMQKIANQYDQGTISENKFKTFIYWAERQMQIIEKSSMQEDMEKIRKELHEMDGEDIESRENDREPVLRVIKTSREQEEAAE